MLKRSGRLTYINHRHSLLIRVAGIIIVAGEADDEGMFQGGRAEPDF